MRWAAERRQKQKLQITPQFTLAHRVNELLNLRQFRDEKFHANLRCVLWDWILSMAAAWRWRRWMTAWCKTRPVAIKLPIQSVNSTLHHGLINRQVDARHIFVSKWMMMIKTWAYSMYERTCIDMITFCNARIHLYTSNRFDPGPYLNLVSAAWPIAMMPARLRVEDRKRQSYIICS